jgi:hypothetical protein
MAPSCNGGFPISHYRAGVCVHQIRPRQLNRALGTTELRAYRIWAEAGSPTGQAGEAVKEKNWLEAEKQVNAEVETRAFQFWEQQGRPVGPEGEAASKKNRHIAEIQLLQETEDEFRRVPIH